MARNTDLTTAGDIVEIVSLADLLDPEHVGTAFDPAMAAAHRRTMCTAPSTAAASAYVAWHNAYWSLSPAERRWLIGAVDAELADCEQSLAGGA